jgi:hypothetical protein
VFKTAIDPVLDGGAMLHSRCKARWLARTMLPLI